jgi:hypothetical protein
MFPEIPAIPSIPAGMPPISGGDATSGNGDSTFNNDTSFGGLNYNKGLPAWAIVAGVVVIVGGVVALKYAKG